MNVIVMSTISEQILSCLFNDKTVQNEMLLELIVEITGYMKSGVSQEVPHSFSRLSEYVNNIIQTEAINKKPLDTILMYGKIWSISSMVKIMECNESSEQQIEVDARQNSDKYTLFKTIEENGGISHKELADKIELSPSALSQKISRLDHDKYFISRQLGRGKYYYITSSGKILLEKMQIHRELPIKNQNEMNQSSSEAVSKN